MAAKKTQTQSKDAAGQEDHGPICAKCGTGSFPRGFCFNLGLCWTCTFERSPEYFAQMSADTVVRAAKLTADRLAEKAAQADLDAELAELLAAEAVAA
jgi:hypothetical protein